MVAFARDLDAWSDMAAFPGSDAGVVSSDQLVLRAAIAAYLGRCRGQTRLHTESDLRIFLRWCAERGLDPLAAVRVDIERYVRWLQDVRRFQPSTVSRRLSIVVGFYRVCVIDALLPHSPADYVRRPAVPAESPTLGLGTAPATQPRTRPSSSSVPTRRGHLDQHQRSGLDTPVSLDPRSRRAGPTIAVRRRTVGGDCAEHVTYLAVNWNCTPDGLAS